MISYFVTYQVVKGSIGLISVKNTLITVKESDHDDVWVQVVDQIRKAEPTAKIVSYFISDDCDFGGEIYY